MTNVRLRLFPANVTLPDELRPLRKVYVLLTDGDDRAGLHIWRRPSDIADVHRYVDWAALPPLPAGRALRNGVQIPLADGSGFALVVGAGSCRCGVLGRWSGPSWATSSAVNA